MNKLIKKISLLKDSIKKNNISDSEALSMLSNLSSHFDNKKDLERLVFIEEYNKIKEAVLNTSTKREELNKKLISLIVSPTKNEKEINDIIYSLSSL